MAYLESDKPVTLLELAKMRAGARKIAMLTAYDASFAALCSRAGVDAILVGDSLGNVIQGWRSTLRVSIDDVIYHTENVARAGGRSFVLADMPFGSYQESREQAMRNAARLLGAGAQMVKLEGGGYVVDTVRFLVERGVPVCGHIGLQPQSVHQLGGYRVQGRTDKEAARLGTEARELQDAGASLLVIELVPSAVAADITASLKTTATIGIGAGPHCDGQVLVLHDMLGVHDGKTARFVRNFMQDADSIEHAVAAYVAAVRDGSFPAAEHAY